MTPEETFEVKLQEHKRALVAQNWYVLRYLSRELHALAKQINDRKTDK